MKQDVQIWLLLAMVLVVLAVQGCSQPPMTTIDTVVEAEEHGEVAQERVADDTGPTDWEAIGRTLGCVFAPETCK